MKTKEIKCHVHKDINLTERLPGERIQMNPFINSIPATLIIELPERKVEITESQFEKAFNEALEIRGVCKAFYPELKQKLFGEER